MSEKSEEAVSCFNEGFCCSQAVLSVYTEEFGLCRETALKIARAFGSGGTTRSSEKGNGANGTNLRGGNRCVYGYWPEIWKR